MLILLATIRMFTSLSSAINSSWDPNIRSSTTTNTSQILFLECIFGIFKSLRHKCFIFTYFVKFSRIK
ncbi:hypothetical protein ACB098_05G117500 [Castanea mollissima]